MVKKKTKRASSTKTSIDGANSSTQKIVKIERDRLRRMVLAMLPESEGLVLQELMNAPFGMLRAELAERTGKAGGTVKRALGKLIEKGLVVEVRDVPGADLSKHMGYRFMPIRWPKLD